LTAGRSLEEDPVNAVKLMASNMLDGIFDDLMENSVLNTDELRKLGEGVTRIVNSTENLFDDIKEKTQKASRILTDHFLNTEVQLSLKCLSENEDDQSEESAASSSSSAESRADSEDEETEQDAGLLAQTSSLALTDPQETQCTQLNKLKLCSRDRFHKMKTKMIDEIYPVMEREGRTRLALIICNKEFNYLPNRCGSEIDLLGMQDLLENLGYSVIVKENLTAEEMEKELQQFAARPEHQSSDSTFLVFMSHGILQGICGVKHRMQEPDVLHDDTIFQIFNNQNCRSLKDKPKVIIMQACRGRGSGMVWVAADLGEAAADTHGHPLLKRCVWSDAITMAHVEKDFIAFKSSTPHNVSWRLDIGSLFISQLNLRYLATALIHTINFLLPEVQRSFETPNIVTQMPTIERVSMTRYFYLFPGN
uniref:Caspase 12/pseudo n=1 Tax=Otolemur garnettii TaxID=30611 RepID=H0WSB8_OTOGA